VDSEKILAEKKRRAYLELDQVIKTSTTWRCFNVVGREGSAAFRSFLLLKRGLA